MTLRRNLFVVAGVLATTLAASALLRGNRLSAEGFDAVVFGGTAAAINAVLSHLLMLRSEGRSTAVFLKLVLGGMAFRMLLMLAAVALAITALELRPLPLVLSLLGHFTLFLGIEMMAVHVLPGAPVAGSR